MQHVKVWDFGVRLFHWLTVLIVFINFMIFEEGKIHETLGYGLILLLLARLVWGIVGTHYARFVNFFPTPSRVKECFKSHHDATGRFIGHNPLGALMIFNLLFTLTGICLTGYLMTTSYFWGSESMEDLHEALANYLIFCVALHIFGVLYESYKSQVNLVLSMITGWKELP